MDRDGVPDRRGELGIALREGPRGDHAVKQRVDELQLDAGFDAELAGVLELLRDRAGLLPVMEDTRSAREEGVHPVENGETLGGLGDGERVR